MIVSLPPEVASAVEHSASPAAVAAALDRLGGDLVERLREDAGLRDAVVAVLGASRSLTQLVVREPDAIEVLAHLDRRARCEPSDDAELLHWKQHEYLRIAARDLTGAATLEDVGGALSEMADDVFRAAWELDATTGNMAVVGMGKYGGHELNYASDVDVLFVGEGDARSALQLVRPVFRVDADLRPEGRDGPLVRTLDAFTAYWRQWAKTWEFQALLKARPVAGPAELGASFAKAASEALWSRPFGADEVREIRAMKARAEGEMAKRGLSEREIKRGRGGIRDIEFAVQLLQLVHGRADPTLRSPTTLSALSELAAAGYVDADDAATFATAYRFLRTVEHRLQLWDEGQVHAVPAGGDALERLARVCGYRGTVDRDAVAAFTADLRMHQAAARSIHERLFFRPLLEAFTGVAFAGFPGAAVEERLAAFGFRSADRTRAALTELTSGLTRSSRLMQQVLPLLLEWLSESPDPDEGLLGLRTLATGQHRSDRLARMFRDAPDGARRLCLLLGSSRLVATGLEHNPEMISDLADPTFPPATPSSLHSLADAVRWRPARERIDGLRRIRENEELRIQIRDLLGSDGVDAVATRLTNLAESVLTEALATARSTTGIDAPVAMIAMGRFGGSELSYASDLDVMVVSDGDPSAERLATELRQLVNGETPASRIYPLDFDLRPEGRQGPLSRSLAGYSRYYAEWAQTWERQALLRGRFVVGDPDLGARFARVARSFLEREVTEDDEREIRRMKARIERERIPRADDPAFHLKLGRGGLADVEWTVQLLQLRHGLFGQQGTLQALAALDQAGHIDDRDAAALRAAYVYCERTRNRLYLVRGATGDALPARPEQLGKLARSLGTTGPELREEYLRVTRRSRDVVQRLFYDAP